MRKVRNIIAILLFAALFWYFYGEEFKHSGIQGVSEEIRIDFDNIKNNKDVENLIKKINEEFTLLFAKLKGEQLDQEEVKQNTVERRSQEAPSQQAFAVSNIEIGDHRSVVEQLVGHEERSSLNEYGVEWFTYHKNYQNFFMIAYDEQDKVAGLYTNQDLITSSLGITLQSTRETVLALGIDPLTSIRKGFIAYQIQNDQEYDTFQIDENYVTVFYDKHEDNKISAIQIISNELEKNKMTLFAKPSDELKAGFEYQLFDLTNATRVNHGIPVLRWDELVSETARDHSADMANHNYFNHQNLEGKSPFERMTEDGIDYIMAGENLATGQLSSIFAHEGLMNSLGHRENILQADYEMLGVGVEFNEEAQPYYTENFLTK